MAKARSYISAQLKYDRTEHNVIMKELSFVAMFSSKT